MNEKIRNGKIYNNHRIFELYSRFRSLMIRSITQWCLEIYYRLEYNRDLAPKAGEILQVTPSEIDYSIPSRDMPNTTANFGVLQGEWDRSKIYWQDTWAAGLVERFKYGKEWEETEYYRTGIKRLQSGDSLGRLDGEQTVENFKLYLNRLDKLYEDIRSNGYDQSSEIIVSIGRNGEWIVHAGNHRRAIARIVETETVPVRIKYRHKRWQEKRQEIYNSTNRKSKTRQKRQLAIELNCCESLLQHPDICRII